MVESPAFIAGSGNSSGNGRAVEGGVAMILPYWSISGSSLSALLFPLMSIGVAAVVLLMFDSLEDGLLSAPKAAGDELKGSLCSTASPSCLFLKGELAYPRKNGEFLVVMGETMPRNPGVLGPDFGVVLALLTALSTAFTRFFPSL